MVNWQVTATTVFCTSVEDFVTLLVYKDGTAKCAGYKKYGVNASKEKLKLLKEKSKKSGNKLDCQGLECAHLKEYKNKVLTKN